MVRSRPLRRLSQRLALLLAALSGGAILTASLPAPGGADTAPGLRARADALRAQSAASARAEHRALLALYGAEAAVGRARRDAALLESRSRALAAREATTRRRAIAVRRSLQVSQARVAEILEVLYVEGEADPIAAVLGASSLDEVLTALESLERAAKQNRRLAMEARDRGRRLAGLQRELRQRRGALDAARADAAAASAQLERAAASSRATLWGIRRRGAVAEQRIASLLAQARAAERASARITKSADADIAATPATEGATASAPAVTASPAAADGTRTLVVDAVAYHLPGRTASGLPVGPGIVAVDPTVIPLGTRMFIPGYGPGIAADTGTAIKGNIIDLWMPSTAAARRWGRKTVTITIYG